MLLCNVSTYLLGYARLEAHHLLLGQHQLGDLSNANDGNFQVNRNQRLKRATGQVELDSNEVVVVAYINFYVNLGMSHESPLQVPS